MAQENESRTERRSNAHHQPQLKIKIIQQGKVIYDRVFDGYVFLDNRNALQMAEKTAAEMEVHTVQTFHSFLKMVVKPHMRTHYLEKLNSQKNLTLKFYL